MIRKLLLLTLLPCSVLGQEHARILEQVTSYQLGEDGRAEIREDYQIRINSEKGKRFAVYFDYTDKFRKISDVGIDILNEQGERIKRLRKSDAREFGFNPSYEISDAKVFVIDPEYQNYPFIMKVSSTVKLSGFISLPTWTPRERFHLAVDKATLTVSRPASVGLRFKEEHLTGTTSRSGDNIVTTYTVSNLPAIEEKIRYTDFYDDQPKVLVSPDKFRLDDSQGSLASWSSFGDWFIELNQQPYLLTDATRAYIDGLDKANQYELIRKIYTYMQDKTRYVSIQMGIGGFKSLPTETVEKFGYGDCKALTTYVRNMLDYAGVHSNYILVRAGRDVPDVEADFPSNQFNHVYLGVPLGKDTVMLECTSQTSPSNYTGTFTDDRNVLWIEKSKSQIIRSRIYNHLENKKNSVVHVNINSDGSAKVDLNVHNTGIFFDEVMIYDGAPKEYVQQYNQKAFPYDDFTIKEFSHKQDDRNLAEFKTNFSLQVNGLAKIVGQRMIMGNVVTAPFENFIRYDDLAGYCSIKRGMTVVDDVEVTLPEGYWIYNLPEPETITSEFGQYQLATEFDGKVLKIKRTFILYKGDYTRNVYAEFKKFHQRVDKLEKRKLVMNGKT